MPTDPTDELRTYRAHRFAITLLQSGDFALFDPRGNLLAIGPITTIATLITDGPTDYDLCIDSWIGRGRPTAATHDFLESLGLLKPAVPPPPIKRRF